MNMPTVVLLLLLALPACMRVKDSDGRPVLKLYDGKLFRSGEWYPVRGDSTAWVTIRVDSLNMGRDHEARTFDGEGFLKTIGHEWAYSPERFKSEAQLPLTDPKQPWTERERERICRICLRHEWQAEKVIPPKPVLSPFDSLKALLQTAFSPYPTTETSVGFPWTSEQSP